MATRDLAQQILQQKLASLQNAPSNVRSNLANHQPADAHPFQVNTGQFPAYPAPASGTVQLLSYQVPQGLVAVINLIAIVAVGGGFVDGSGNVIWRCWINGVGVDGLQNITAHMGNFDTPVPIQIVLTENDLFYITVEVATNPMPSGATSGARINGWTYPLAKVTTS
jgi:hypothetical protein